jgi:CRP/FNR family transcriptional regulator
VSGSCFSSISSENIYLKAFGYEQAVHRFSDALWAMQEILFLGVDQRLAAYLLRESGTEKSTVLSIRQEKIAADIGTSREVVSRMLRYFHEAGLTSNARGKIELLDLPRLKERAGL